MILTWVIFSNSKCITYTFSILRYFSLFFIRKYLLNHLALKIHIFCPIDFIDFNGAENVNFVCQIVLQVFSYKKQTLEPWLENSIWWLYWPMPKENWIELVFSAVDRTSGWVLSGFVNLIEKKSPCHEILPYTSPQNKHFLIPNSLIHKFELIFIGIMRIVLQFSCIVFMVVFRKWSNCFGAK